MERPTNLVPASGHQDHAISPSAAVSIVSAQKRLKLSRPSHPALNVRDDREAPLNERGTGEKMLLICPTPQAPRGAADWHDGQSSHGEHAQTARRAIGL